MYKEGIISGLKKKFRHDVIARKIYLSFPTNVFQNKQEEEFELINLIKNFFKIPFKAVQIAGSSKTGYSYFHNREFKPGESDLDVAIIDSALFQNYCEIVLAETEGFRNLSSFSRNREGISNHISYFKYIAKGIFRPDLMPICDSSKKWFNFFNKLSNKYIDYFSNINAGIYLSEKCFEIKQAENIKFFEDSIN